MSIITRRSLFAGILILTLLACNLPNLAPTVDPSVAQTMAALTVAAIVSQRQTAMPSPFATPISTLSPTDTLTPIPTLSPTPLWTSTPTAPRLSVSVDTNCRVGPGKIYDRVGALLVGETAEVVAKDPSGDYWYIRNSDSASGFCWVWGQYATLTGNMAFLPVYTPPPTPTPTPDFALVKVRLDSCVEWWLNLSLENTGPITFESISLVIKDQTAKVTLSDVSNNFAYVDGCTGMAVVQRIPAGGTRTVSTPSFGYDPSGHKFAVTIKLCTADNLNGNCVSKQLSFKL